VRVIIRFSLDKDDGTLGIALRNGLEAAGFVKTGTSQFEHLNITMPAFSAAVAAFWNTMQHPPQNTPAAAALDHFWLFTDLKVPPAPAAMVAHNP
jgi:hypothetical protein